MTQEEQILELLKQSIKNTKWENKVFLVGGAVRDQVMGKPPKDLDFVIDGNILSGIDFSTWLAKKWGVFKDKSNPVIFPSYGTAKLSYDNVDLEFVAPRKEKYKSGSRKPEVSSGVLMDDVLRRDLTINTLMRNVSTNEILDLTGNGISDLKSGIIRTPSDPKIIFQDDPLRMLRSIRFAVKYNFKFDNNILSNIKKYSNLITTISQERIQDELNKILMTNNPAIGIDLLQKTRLLKQIIPELDDMVGLEQNKYHNEDAYQHTLTVLKNTPPNLLVRLMALFHDIGKVATKSITDSGDVHFYGHENESEIITRKVMSRLRYPNDIINTVALGVKKHMSLKHGLDDAINLSDKTLRKFATDTGEYMNDILDLIHADNVSHSDTASMPNQVKNIKNRIEKLNTGINKFEVKLPIDGNDIKKILGINNGPLIGKIKNAVQDAWYENPNLTKDQAIEIIKKIGLENQITEIKRLMKIMIINS